MTRKPPATATPWRVRLESEYRIDRDVRVRRVYEIVLPETVQNITPVVRKGDSHEQGSRPIRASLER